MKKLVIIDYFFKDDKGHDGRHDCAIAEEAIRQGIETTVLCPKLNAVPVPFFVKKSLRFPSHGRRGLLWYFVEIVSRFFELRKLWRNHKKEKETLFFVSTIDDHFFVSLFFSLLFLRMKPKIMVMVRRGLSEYAARSRSFVTRFKILFLSLLMSFLHAKKNIIFCSDSELIVQNLVRRGFANSVTVPIIVRANAKKISLDKKEIVIAYVGGARFDKGFDVLPFIVEKMIGQKVKFVIQTYMHDLEKNAVVVSAKDSLQAFARAYPDKVELVDRPLSESEYVSLLERCSVVLLPYRQMFYGQGISGIFAEAVAVGAWVVVPSGSWMDAQKEKYDRVVAVDEISADGVVMAVEKCLKNNDKINVAHLQKQMQSWRRFHSAKTFIEIISEQSGGA